MRTLSAFLLLLVVATPALAGDVVSIQLPNENARLKPGPGYDKAKEVCVTCHSADYVYMQPAMTKQQWTATVMKMKKVMGAPIADGDVEAIVGYLMSQNGKN